MRRLLIALVVVVTVLPFLRRFAVAAGEATPAPACVTAGCGSPGAGLRTVRVRTYSMSGQIRPLLFWVGQDDIGLARVTWREGTDGAKGYELLVGTDPARAPRALNRWGYVSEEARPGHATLLALMTGAPDTSLDEATSTAGRGGGDFRAIRNEMTSGGTSWHVARVRTPDTMTVHDVERVLERVARETPLGRRGTSVLPSDTRPGFLVALAELVERGAGQVFDRAGIDQLTRERVPFVFGRGRYELKLRDTQPHTADLDGRATPAVTSTFEIQTLATGARTRFAVTFATTASLAGVPVAAEWQPRWWLKVRLRLKNEPVDATGP